MSAPRAKPQKPAPRVVVFAGPNGAGKSTHADAILATLGITTFVNADFIARGLSGRHTEAVTFTAGRIMLERLHQLVMPAKTSPLKARSPAAPLPLFCATSRPGATEWPSTTFPSSTPSWRCAA